MKLRWVFNISTRKLRSLPLVLPLLLMCVVVLVFTRSWNSRNAFFTGSVKSVKGIVEDLDEEMSLSDFQFHDMSHQKCGPGPQAQTNFTSWEIYPQFELGPMLTNRKEFFEDPKYAHLFQEYEKSNPKDLPKLKVILVPWSHWDPGWGQTPEGYYQWVKVIMKGYLERAPKPEYKNLTFILAEIFFLDRLWQDLDGKEKESLKELVERGRLEVITGGWVMTDEASPSLYAMLDQLIEGNLHQSPFPPCASCIPLGTIDVFVDVRTGHWWLKHHLGVEAVSGMAMDPFGVGATLPYLLHESGVSNIIIQRIHHEWKRWFAMNKVEDFKWRQTWDGKGEMDVLCHHRALTLYGEAQSCGPDRKICEQFDFVNLGLPNVGAHGQGKTLRITPDNVAEKAGMLLTEMRKLDSLSRHHVILHMIGEDFRYRLQQEWDNQYLNYMMLADHINRNSESYHAEVEFGTLKTYFEEVRKRVPSFPTFKGDFFPYKMKYEDVYWTGYFSTRPFWKAKIRHLERLVRVTEMWFTVTWNNPESVSSQDLSGQVYSKIVQARQELALFQHHDSITGTSPQHVMYSHNNDLHRTLQVLQSSLVSLGRTLLNIKGVLNFSDTYDHNSCCPKPQCLRLKGDKTSIVAEVFNPLTTIVTNVINVCLKTKKRVIDVSLLNGTNLPFHVEMNGNQEDILLTVLVPVPPLTFATIPISYQSISEGKNQHMLAKEGMKFSLENYYLLFQSTEDGKFNLFQNKQEQVSISLQYSLCTYPGIQGRDGSYTFAPIVQTCDPILPVRSHSMNTSVFAQTVQYFDVLGIELSFTVYKTQDYIGQGLHVSVRRETRNPTKAENVILRFQTPVKTQNVFYTDASGFQMVKRVRTDSAGVAGNYYPITSAMYMEDSGQERNTRFTLLMDHAHGGGSMNEGQMEVMLDRTSFHDDGKGMGQGAADSLPWESKFIILVEEPPYSNSLHPFLSPLAGRLNLVLNHPFLVLLHVDPLPSASSKGVSSIFKEPFPCHIHLLNLRTFPDSLNYTLPSNEALMVLDRSPLSCPLCDSKPKGILKVEDMFVAGMSVNVTPTRLDGIVNLVVTSSSSSQLKSVMGLSAFRLGF